jgi:copper(I)-binding protein
MKQQHTVYGKLTVIILMCISLAFELNANAAAPTTVQKSPVKPQLKDSVKKEDWKISNPRIYLPRPGSKATAGYFELTNQSIESMTIGVIAIPPFAKVETHETVKENEQAKMIQVDQFSLPSKETLKLVPGGKHIMLFEPQKQLQAGQILRGKLKIQNQIVEVDFKVIERSQDQNQGQHMHH